MERVKNEIFESHCFDRLKKSVHNLEEWVDDKIHPISGDMMKEGIGMSVEDRELITSQTQVVINCAASIDFNARLDIAININIRGALRIQQLAKECGNIEVFTHVSTCYVNSDKLGDIEEKIYDVDFDVEAHIKYLENLSIPEIEA